MLVADSFALVLVPVEEGAPVKPPPFTATPLVLVFCSVFVADEPTALPLDAKTECILVGPSLIVFVVCEDKAGGADDTDDDTISICEDVGVLEDAGDEGIIIGCVLVLVLNIGFEVGEVELDVDVFEVDDRVDVEVDVEVVVEVWDEVVVLDGESSFVVLADELRLVQG